MKIGFQIVKKVITEKYQKTTTDYYAEVVNRKNHVQTSDA